MKVHMGEGYGDEGGRSQSPWLILCKVKSCAYIYIYGDPYKTGFPPTIANLALPFELHSPFA